MRHSSPTTSVVTASLAYATPLTRTFALIVAALLMHAPALVAQGVLADAGFESGQAVPGGIGGWEVDSGSPVFVQNDFRSGNWSLQANYGLNIDASIVIQWVGVEPDTAYSLTGWGMTPVRLGSSRVGYLYLTFWDSNHVQVGQGFRSGYISSTSPLNTWLALSITATAPAGAAYAKVVTGVGFSQGIGPLPNNAVYFDDLSMSPIPEPSFQALLVTGVIGGLWFHSRRHRSRRIAM